MGLQSFPVFVINLERDTLRREHMVEQLHRLGIKAEFVPAVDGRTLSPSERAAYDRNKALRIYGVEMMDSEIGCYLSHFRLYERMVDEDIGFALVLEDDVEIGPELLSLLSDLIADPCPEWLVVRLESMRSRVIEPSSPKFLGQCVKQLQAGDLYKLGTHTLGLGGYFIRKEGAQRMLDYGRRIFMPIDQTMDRFWENGILPYIIRPIPIRQQQCFESSIGARPSDRHRANPLGLRLIRRWQRFSDGVRKRIFLILH